MIPPLTHQIYFGFDGPLEDKPVFVRSREALSEYMPDWLHTLWSAGMLERLVGEKFPEHLAFYRELRHTIQRVDFGRYCILAVYGGFYLDLDMEVKRSLDPLWGNDLLFYEYEKNGRRYEIDFLGSSTGNVFWRQVVTACVEGYAEKAKMDIYRTWKGRFVMQTTGPYFFDRTVKVLRPKCTVLPVVENPSLGLRGEYVRNHSLHSWGEKGVS